MRLIRYEKPAWKDKVERMMEFRLNVRHWCPAWIWVPFYRDPAGDAALYFRMLGGDGAPVVPELERTAVDPRRGISAARAVDAMGEIGTAALPALMKVATNRQANTRLKAVLAISQFGSNAVPAKPTLLECLKDNDWRVVANAVQILGELTLDPQTCVPAISSHLHDLHPMVRRVALLSLARFGGEARSAIPAVRVLLADPDWGIRREATNTLQKIALEGAL
jgi:HEAT repeat protein